jgi:hypothetical protein
MLKTPIPLYRQGNATSPRMDNVRPDKDVATFMDEGVVWVLTTLADSTLPGDISTFASQGRGKNLWKLDPGIDIPIELELINDHNNHWLWQPSMTMPIDEYKAALKQVGEFFYKIN